MAGMRFQKMFEQGQLPLIFNYSNEGHCTYSSIKRGRRWSLCHKRLG
jgi:hypothetical protein